MPKISSYVTNSSPKLSDKLIGTSVGGTPNDVTYNFTLQELKDLFDGTPTPNNLQQVLDQGNSATQDIFLTGKIEATDLEIANDVTFTNVYISGLLYDRINSFGTSGQVLSSTGTGVEWITISTEVPTLQQVLNAGNIATDDITLTGAFQSTSVSADTITATSDLNVNGTLSDSISSNGTSGQVLSSTGTAVTWVDLPTYSAASPLNYNNVSKQFSIQVANGTQNGYLSSSDWITFDGKQPAGNYITALTGEATASGPGVATITLGTSAVTGKPLTGLNVTGGSVSSSDSMLTAFGKLQNQINGLIGGVTYQGTWDASSNTPTLASGVGVNGHYYIVNIAGSTNLDGITDWVVGDWVIFDGTAWQQVDNTDAVVSVNGQVGAVNLVTTNIPEGTNLYFTNSRARAALSFAAGSGAYDNTTGVITIPTDNSQILNGANYITLGSLSASAPLSYNSLTGQFSISQSGASSNGYLSSTDWNLFNNKQQALSGTGIVVSNSGTISYITNDSVNWTTAYNNMIVSAAVSGTTTKTLTLTQQDGGTVTADWTDGDTGLTSVGVSMPSAFSVSNSPLTSNGTIEITGAGSTSQYIDGTGALQTFPTISTDAQALIREVYNETGATLTKGTVVIINTGHGNLPSVTKALATSDLTSAQTFGLVKSDISDQSNGFVICAGGLGDLNTNGLGVGSALYLSSTVAGQYTTTKQYAPAHLVYIGVVVRDHPTQGVIEVKIQNGYEMDELHNVSAQNPNNNDILQYKTSTGLWTSIAGTTTNIAEGSNLYYLDSRARAALSFVSGSGAYNSTTGVITIPTNTNELTNGAAFITLGSLSASSPLNYNSTTGAFTINQSSGSQSGYLSSTDWNTFNNKQPAGDYITSLTGEATASGPGAATITLGNSAVTGKLLTGVNITGGSIGATDSMLTAFGKLQNQINGLIGGSIYQGTWNASTNTPALASGVGTKGYYYIVSVAGSTNLDGITDWNIGDWAIFDGTAWQQVDNTDSVVSVNGFTGAVSLTTDNISEGTTNLYYLDSRARAALSFSAGSGAYNSTTGVITIPTNTSQLTNGANFITLGSLSGTAPISYNSGTGAISITQAGASSNGYLSSTDWNTFNNKQSPLTLTTTGSTGAATLSGSTLNIPNYGAAIVAPYDYINMPVNTLVTVSSNVEYITYAYKWEAIGNYYLPIWNWDIDWANMTYNGFVSAVAQTEVWVLGPYSSPQTQVRNYKCLGLNMELTPDYYEYVTPQAEVGGGGIQDAYLYINNRISFRPNSGTGRYIILKFVVPSYVKLIFAGITPYYND